MFFVAAAAAPTCCCLFVSFSMYCYNFMNISPFPAITDCIQDADCPVTTTICLRNHCDNPCLVSQPCGINAECKVLDTRPVRTMTCVCLEG